MLGLDRLKKALQLQEEQQELTDYGDEFKPTTTHATLRGYRAPVVEMGPVSEISRGGAPGRTVTAELGPIQEISRNGVPSERPMMGPTSPLGAVRDMAFGAGTQSAAPAPDEMEQANRSENEANLLAGMGRAGSRFAATLGKLPQDTSHWDKIGADAAQRRSAVSKFLQAKALKGMEADAEKRKLDAAALDKMYGRKHDDAVLSEASRHNRAMEARPPGGGIFISPELNYRMGRDAQDDARKAQDKEAAKQKSVSEIEERSRNMNKTLDDMADQIKKYGTFEAFGPENANLDALITSYAIDMAKLRDPTSVAREGEVEMERKALGNPGAWTDDNTILALIKKAKERIGERRAEAYRARNLDMPVEAESQAAPASAPLRKTVNGKTYENDGTGWFEVE